MTDLILTDPAALSIAVPKESDEPPVRVGGVIPVREEWRLVSIEIVDFSEPFVEVTIEFRDGACSTRIVHAHAAPFLGDGDDGPSNWQPASTMPDWAARQHRRVCKVECVKSVDLTCGEFAAAFDPENVDADTIYLLFGDRYVWKIYLGTDWAGGSREEAEAIYERYGCEGAWAFDYDDNNGVLIGHISQDTGIRVSVGDTVYKHNNNVFILEGL